MSGCKCDDPRRFRVTGELIERSATADPRTVGTGTLQARVRCVECGGKVAYVGSDLLNMMGISDDEIAPCSIDHGDEYELTVDLV